jgi:ribosomal protein L21
MKGFDRFMERKFIRLGVRLTEAIIEILKEELGNDTKESRANENRQKKVKAFSKRTKKNSVRSYGFSSN